jgi:ABC-type transporter Mla subunit MlaD
MAIKFPAHLQGVTAGALRQAQQQGSTTASGGLMTTEQMIALATDTKAYLDKREPLGNYMNALEKATEDSKAMTEALLTNVNAMVNQAKESQKQLNDINGKLRDGADKLALAIEKFGKIAGNANFAETAKQAESLVDSLERLAKLEESGVLDKVIKAMSK